MGVEELATEDPRGGQGLVAVVAVGKGTDPSGGAQEEPRQGGLSSEGRRCPQTLLEPGGTWPGQGWDLESPRRGSRVLGWGGGRTPSLVPKLGIWAAVKTQLERWLAPLKCGWGFLGVPTGLLPHTQRDTSSRAGGCLCNTRSAEGLSCWPPLPAQCPHQVTGGLPHGSHPAPWRSPYPCAALAGGTGSSVWHLGTAPGAFFSQGSGVLM